MNEITPELIAAIATRLYNEIPGANLVPKTETDMYSSVPVSAELPSGFPGEGLTTPIISGTGPDTFGEPGAAGYMPDSLGIPGIAGLGPRLPDFPGNTVATPESFSEPGIAETVSQAHTIPNLKGLFTPEGFNLPGLPGISPSWPGVPSTAGTIPENFNSPSPTGSVSQGYSASIPKDFTLHGTSVPGLATDLPGTFGVPNPKGFAPDGMSMPGAATDLPATFGVPNPKGLAPDGISIPGVATDLPGTFGVPNPKGFVPDGMSIPGLATDLPATFGVPNPKGLAPEGMSIPGAATDLPATYGVPNPKGFPPDGMSVPGATTDLPATFGVPSPKGFAPDDMSVPGLATDLPASFGVPNPKEVAPYGLNVPGLPGHTLEGFEFTNSAGVTPTSYSVPDSAVNTPDGLSAFVQLIRSTQIRNETGQCVAGHDQDLIQRLVAGNAVPETGSRPLDIATIRKDFPILNQLVHGKPLAWLDNAATTQKPQSVIDTLSYFYAHDNSNIHRGAHTLAARSTDAFERARQKVQAFLGASSAKEIIYVRGTTEGVNLVAQTYGRKFLQPGDEIILSTLEHHANIVPWQMVANERGAVLRIIPVNDRGEVMLETYEALLGPKTKLVALTQASNSLGTILPVTEMTHAAKRYGARVLIDGAQSVSHMPVNVQEIGCDFFVFSGHKIFAPTGIGVVYIKEELLEILPPWQGGGNMIKDVTFEETTYNEAPAKFEAGTPNIADAIGLGAALDYVSRLGLINTGKYEHELLQHATEQLSRINGLRLIGTAREKVAVISFVLRDRKTEEVGRLLDQEGLAVRAGHHCSQPSLRRFGVEATVRPSFAFYNTFDEIDRLAEAVRRILRI